MDDKESKIMEDWIIPCNPETYDLFGAFDSLQTVDWRQRAKSKVWRALMRLATVCEWQNSLL
jgi:hypothetical protein